MMIFGHMITSQVLFSQLVVGLINGSFYALLSLGLAVIFGMLNIVNFAHGAFFMVGAFVAYFLLHLIGLNYWAALLLTPIIVGLYGALIHLTIISPNRLVLYIVLGLNIGGLVIEVVFWLMKLEFLAALLGIILVFCCFGISIYVIERIVRNPIQDHLYGLLLTFGLALIIQGLFQNSFGSSGLPYPAPDELKGALNLGFMYLPKYRGWVIIFSAIVCFAVWFLIEKTKLGAYLRAATENPTLVRAFGINVPLMITATYGFGVGLAALAGVLAAPINQVRPGMGADIIAVVFAVVVIGGMGSILGSILTGFTLGVVEGLTKVFYPEASNTVVFVIMAIVLIWRPSGLFGRVA